MRKGGKSNHRSAFIARVVSGILHALPILPPVALALASTTQVQALESTSLTADIPAQRLDRALEIFARQTSLQLVYVSAVVHEQRSHAVSTGLRANEALANMLEGTGLRFEYLTPRSIHILAETNSPPRPQETMRNLPSGDAIQEVIVTANRREENLQKIPMAIQVLTGDTLSKIHATTFDDFLRYLPAITAHGVGPGQTNIYVRGLATGGSGLQAAGFGGEFPNVAVYLDEQSAQLPFRNLDIYAVDLDRIEVLEGPQGTLFGAGAQAGVVRYITNKPKLDVTEGLINTSYATTAHGAQSTSVDATINIPLIEDRLAVRGVIYNERRGGYIDNNLATFARAGTDLGFFNYEGGKVPADSVVINNQTIAGNDTNPVTYQGIRAEALFQFNENWSALLAQSYQSIEADGVFAEMAADSQGQAQPDLSVQLFNPSYDKDRFENTALTIEGRVGALKLVYTGAYLVRHIEQVQDYTSYARGALANYYQCANPTLSSPHPDPAAARCFTPSSTWRDLERNTHQSHELRLRTPGDWRIRAVGGLFY